MPSPQHEILELFRNCGELAPELLHACAGIELAHDRVELTSIDLSQVTSTEYRADSVVELRDRRGELTGAVVVEVQLRPHDDKLYTWPLYVAALRAKLRCPVTLLVITPASAVARWARRPISLGHPGFSLQPIAVSFDDLPRILDAVQARRMPELAVLSAMAHPELEVAATAIEAIATLPEDQNRRYLDVILATLPDAIRTILEARMKGYVYQSEFARKYYNQGLEEGRQKGHLEGRQEGLEEGRDVWRREGLRTAAIALARAKLPGVTAEDQAAIEALQDEPALTELIAALGRATTPSEARAVFQVVFGAPRGA